MSGMFVPAAETIREQLDWGSLGWCCRPSATAAEQVVVIEVTLIPGGGHAFHKHPRQEEVIYVIAGSVEQWLGEGKRTLGPGDSIFIPADGVHASFNTTKNDAKLLAILGPCIGREDGYEVVEVADQEPWNGLR